MTVVLVCLLWAVSVFWLSWAHRHRLQSVCKKYQLTIHDQALAAWAKQAEASRRELAAVLREVDTQTESAVVRLICEAWKSYALGYEVFCEATYDGDMDGILSAAATIAAARNTLQGLNQYSA